MFTNRYIFIYSAILVVIVATALTITALQLKPMQQENIRIEKMQNILKAVNINADVEHASELFNKYITDSYIVNIKGEKIENINAFDIDLNKELKKTEVSRNLPVFECTFEDSEIYYIVPLRGKGLWGPIWGYIGLYDDFNTIYGAFFDHQGETPGLGAEIDTEKFQSQFKGKKIFNDKGEFISVKVIKGGAKPENTHGVDAISGGTITSDGVTEMLSSGLLQYIDFFKQQQNNE